MLAEGLLAEGLLAEGLLAEGLLTEGLLAEGLLAEGLLAEGLLAEGLLAEGLLAVESQALSQALREGVWGASVQPHGLLHHNGYWSALLAAFGVPDSECMADLVVEHVRAVSWERQL